LSPQFHYLKNAGLATVRRNWDEPQTQLNGAGGSD